MSVIHFSFMRTQKINNFHGKIQKIPTLVTIDVPKEREIDDLAPKRHRIAVGMLIILKQCWFSYQNWKKKQGGAFQNKCWILLRKCTHRAREVRQQRVSFEEMRQQTTRAHFSTCFLFFFCFFCCIFCDFLWIIIFSIANFKMKSKIPRISDPSTPWLEILVKFGFKNEPFILGEWSTSGWTAVKDWVLPNGQPNKEYLKKSYGLSG